MGFHSRRSCWRRRSVPGVPSSVLGACSWWRQGHKTFCGVHAKNSVVSGVCEEDKMLSSDIYALPFLSVHEPYPVSGWLYNGFKMRIIKMGFDL